MKRFNSTSTNRVLRCIATVCALLCLAAPLTSLAANSTTPKTGSAPEAPIYFPPGQTSVLVPFDSYSNLVIVQAKVNGAGPLSFALDTAFPTSLIDTNVVKGLNLPVVYINPKKKNSPQMSTFDLKIDSIDIPNQQATVVSLANLPTFLGIKVDGILGMDLFQRFGITINYDTRALTFTQNGLLTQPPGSDALELTVSPQGLLAPIEISPQKGSPIFSLVKIDTGSLDALELCDSFILSTHVVTPTQQEFLVAGGFSESAPGEHVYVTRIGSVRFGRYIFDAPLIIHDNDVTPHPYAGTVGGELLRRFTVTFDLLRNRLYLAPGGSVHEPFLYDASGLTLTASGPTLHTYTVAAVRPYSPAQTAQIQIGDVLTSIDGQSAQQLTLADVRTILEQAGQTYPATFSRAGKTLSVTLDLKWRV